MKKILLMFAICAIIVGVSTRSYGGYTTYLDGDGNVIKKIFNPEEYYRFDVTESKDSEHKSYLWPMVYFTFSQGADTSSVLLQLNVTADGLKPDGFIKFSGDFVLNGFNSVLTQTTIPSTSFTKADDRFTPPGEDGIVHLNYTLNTSWLDFALFMETSPSKSISISLPHIQSIENSGDSFHDGIMRWDRVVHNTIIDEDGETHPDSTTPEPATLLMLGGAFVGLPMLRRFRKQA